MGKAQQKALIIGNTDGIGLALTVELLRRGWEVAGISRRPSSIDHASYGHIVAGVEDADYPSQLTEVARAFRTLDLCVYCAGIGEMLDLADMAREAGIIKVNLLGLVETTSRIVPFMVARGKGHFIGLSSMADELPSAEAPSYAASKAGFSSYLEGLALALRERGVYVSNVRFGFVDTKMAKSDAKPFIMSVDRAVAHVISCVEKKPVRYTAPMIAVPFFKAYRMFLKSKLFWYSLKGPRKRG